MAIKNKKTVLLGMSGGVDSSVSAYLLKKQGYKVIGAFMKNYSETKNPITSQCSYLDDKKSAQTIASILKIPLIYIDSEREYKEKVLTPMYKSYSKNLTPNPDISCNTIIKFPILWKAAKKQNADFISTGHYAIIKKTSKGFSLLSGKDKNKDQSYFLSELNQFDLSHTLFPIGNLKKEKVRNLAKKIKLPNWNKQGTRGICFVGKTNMQTFLSKKIPQKPGKVITPENILIGTHPGAMYYTIGQRIGQSVGISFSPNWKNEKNEKLYIANKKNNILIAVPENHILLKRKKIKILKLHLINPEEKIPNNLKARIRHLGELHSGTLSKNKKEFTFKKPVKSLAEGQYIVLYNKDNLIASGEIRFK
ncbi:tRNA 2-thiouridine(34) synthase MnmA [Candidatus Pacearchaeota archaeon CG10_big_fil_rev_8_21_14_0_10_31_24]|nr:MAG: tRNA 2-thiouridine(34) synthase MnmA [Candidatus Pacearchaeota archaeon CG10_big_fil_rev_8_21_14_0_10_31_24]